MQPIIPFLRIADVTKAKEYYVDWPGFSIDSELRFRENFPLYCQVSIDGTAIQLTEHYSDYIPGARTRIQITGVSAIQQK